MSRSIEIPSVCVVVVGVLAPLIGLAAEGQAPARAPWSEAALKKGYAVFEHSTIENLPASHAPGPNDVVKKVSCALARDEYESVQIGVHALTDDIKDLRVEVESELKVTVYHRISPAVKEQLASLYKAGNGIARWMPSEVHLQRGNGFQELPKGRSVGFWLTFHANREMREGPHRGKIRIKPADRPETVLDLEVSVRPFELQRPGAAFGVWLREDMLPKRFGGLATPKEVVLAIYRDMVAHGHNSNWFYPWGRFSELPPGKSQAFDKLMPLSQQAGLLDPNIPWLICGDTPADIEDDGQRKAAVAWLEAERRKRGWPEIIAFGPDEPKYPHDADEVRKLTRMRGLTMRVNLDQSSAAAVYGYGGDLCDVQTVMDGLISPEMLAEARRVGTETWTYTYRIWREGFDPLPQRYFAGLYTWTHRLGGNWVWAYHHGHHRYAWFEPEGREPMPVTGWEARREGIDDYRYLQMVEDSVAADPAKPLAIEAAKWLDALRTRIAPTVPNKVKAGQPLAIHEYDEIRAKAAGYIQELGAVPDEAVTRSPATHAKDEAAPYRGKSVEECLAGLARAEVSQRRAAAWALFEMGPKAAPATRPLAGALDDPEVRIPALRALEAAVAQPLVAAFRDDVPDVSSHAEEMLAAIGPAESAAIPALEKYAQKENPGPMQATSYSVLFRIRGQVSDLQKMIGLLHDAQVKADMKDHVVKILNQLGARAAPVADQVRQMLESGKAPDRKRGLRAFLDKVAKGDRPGF